MLAYITPYIADAGIIHSQDTCDEDNLRNYVAPPELFLPPHLQMYPESAAGLGTIEIYFPFGGMASIKGVCSKQFKPNLIKS